MIIFLPYVNICIHTFIDIKQQMTEPLENNTQFEPRGKKFEGLRHSILGKIKKIA